MEDLNSFKIRSFVVGRGRITASQLKAIERFSDEWLIKVQKKKISPKKLFYKNAPTTLEIGFGMGDVLIDSAFKNPNSNFLGIEVYKSGIGKVLGKINSLGIKNIRLMQGDAVEICEEMFEKNSFANINLLFPDPWPKKRHHKRRIIKKDFVNTVVENLVLFGCFFCATDNTSYAEQIISALTNCSRLKNLSTAFSKRPHDRILSKFEKKAIESKREIFNLSFMKIM